MIETKDLRLRKAVFKDWRDMYERVWRHSETAKYMLWTVTDNEGDAKDRMERTIAYQRKNPCGYIVCEKSSDRPIGFAGMIEIEPEVWEDTGIALGPEFTGKGYGQQVLMGLVDEAFRQWGQENLFAAVEVRMTHPVECSLPVDLPSLIRRIVWIPVMTHPMCWNFMS